MYAHTRCIHISMWIHSFFMRTKDEDGGEGSIKRIDRCSRVDNVIFMPQWGKVLQSCTKLELGDDAASAGRMLHQFGLELLWCLCLCCCWRCCCRWLLVAAAAAVVVDGCHWVSHFRIKIQKCWACAEGNTHIYTRRRIYTCCVCVCVCVACLYINAHITNKQTNRRTRTEKEETFSLLCALAIVNNSSRSSNSSNSNNNVQQQQQKLQQQQQQHHAPSVKQQCAEIFRKFVLPAPSFSASLLPFSVCFPFLSFYPTQFCLLLGVQGACYSLLVFAFYFF